ELHSIPVPDGTVLDGEIIVTNSEGKPDFELVMERFKSKRSPYKITFCVFDVIYLENKSLSQLSLIDRKEILESTIPEDTDVLAKVKWLYGNGIGYFAQVKNLDLEGIVLKDKKSKYQSNTRSKNWLKVINYKYIDVY